MSLRSRRRITARVRRHALAGLPRRVAALEQVVTAIAPVVGKLVEHASASTHVIDHLTACATASELDPRDFH